MNDAEAEAPEPEQGGPSRPAAAAGRGKPGRAAQVDSTVRLSVALLDKLMNLAGELVLIRNQNIQAVGAGRLDRLAAISQRLDLVTSDLQASIMRTRMRPMGAVLNPYRRVVRDLAKRLGKEILLEIEGADVELDKSIIEAIADPLTHLVRNAVGHGIELPEERRCAGKLAVGRISLLASHRAGQVSLLVEDDGKGLDPEELRATALRRELMSREAAEAASPQELFDLVFLPGFTTATEVTDLSGRGVGMDVVAASIKKLGGSIELSSVPRVGTTVAINLPLTLAILPALIFAVEASYFAIPQANVAEVVWLHGEEIRRSLEVVDDQEVYWLRGQLLPVLRLSSLLEMEAVPVPERRERRGPKANDVYIVVIKLAHERFGLLVDRIIDTQEIVAKALHDRLKSSGAYAGTTVLGDGRIAIILDAASLAKLGALRPTRPDAPLRRSGSSSYSSSTQDRQAVLLFDIGGPETFAVPLRLITRVEETRVRAIKVAKGREYLGLRGEVVPLVRMERAIPELGVGYDDDLLYVVIPRSRRPIGIAAAHLIDTITAWCRIDSQTVPTRGIVGSALIGDTLALFPDLFQIIEMVEPGWFREDRLAGSAGARVLLLEDSAFYAALLAPVLRSAGLEVIHAHNGEEGLERLTESTFDLVVSDLDMPVLDGLAFARRARKRIELRGMHMLALSARSDRVVESEAMAAGFDEFLSKLDHEVLLSRLRAFAAGRVERS